MTARLMSGRWVTSLAKTGDEIWGTVRGPTSLGDAKVYTTAQQEHTWNGMLATHMSNGGKSWLRKSPWCSVNLSDRPLQRQGGESVRWVVPRANSNKQHVQFINPSLHGAVQASV